jgi:Uma2 family endonuclease
MLIEISDATLEVDKKVKIPRYAASGIPEVWIVNLIDDIVEVYREPIKHPDGAALYQEQRNLVKGDTLAPKAWPSLEIAVDDALL